jgi:hypothetical protein
MSDAKTFFFCLTLLVAASCTTGEWKAENVPAPRATPFDANQFARNAYLEGFRHGYRAQRSGGPPTVEMLTGPHLEARRQGFYAGAAQARAESARDEKDR